MPYPGGTKTVGGPVGVGGKMGDGGPRKVFLPLSAFFLQMSGDMDGDGGEIIGFRRKKKDRKKDRKKKTQGGGNDDDTKGPKTGATAGSGSGNDAIGKDSTAGAAPKAEATLRVRWKKLPPPAGKPFETVGYEAKTPMGKATVTKRKKGRGFTWVLKVGKHEVLLGRKADFDHAEGELLRISKLTEARVQTSAQGGRRYARMMALTNVGGDGSCSKCGSEPGVNIDCKKCMATTEMTTSGAAGGVTKQGATHSSTGGVMGTGNVPVAPRPIGSPLRRTGDEDEKKRKKRKKKQEWAERLLALTAL